ncbi:inositol monophosphatase [Nocardioides sp. dk4132]|uniref:inositol monophosphatase family protein n=1 Tax=unclassified Nocardioides TaxID=2615069 RepID=UPI001297E6A5|nr:MULTISPECIES: inositol monophosphatase family protein [unclassified Nocardioides]MQW74906.1 inositol monophosphatase [Nocardioides sp. dk4132]QGA07903.1 inositol monophosphatase [Nocardioides sp. dk884]
MSGADDRPSDRPSDAELAVRLVTAGGQLAQRMRAEGLDAEQKTSVSDLVTAADRAAERAIVDALAAERPADGVLGEEGSVHDGTSGRTWVIDPVDGTYNFVAGLDWWCSALALRDGEDLLLGAVHHPASGTTYVGGPGLPATADGVPLAPLVDRPLAQSCLATYLHPPFLGTPVEDAFARAARRAATLRMLGSGSMDAMAVASGMLHVVCQHSVPPWDELPGAAIIRALGGETRHVEAAGKRWYVAGVPTAVAEVCAALTEG